MDALIATPAFNPPSCLCLGSGLISARDDLAVAGYVVLRCPCQEPGVVDRDEGEAGGEATGKAAKAAKALKAAKVAGNAKGKLTRSKKLVAAGQGNFLEGED